VIYKLVLLLFTYNSFYVQQWHCVTGNGNSVNDGLLSRSTGYTVIIFNIWVTGIKFLLNFRSRTVHLDIITLFTPTDAQVWFRTMQQTYTSKDLIIQSGPKVGIK